MYTVISIQLNWHHIKYVTIIGGKKWYTLEEEGSQLDYLTRKALQIVFTYSLE